MKQLKHLTIATGIVLLLLSLPLISTFQLSARENDNSQYAAEKPRSNLFQVVENEAWQYAAIAPPGLMQQVKKENLNPNALVDPGRMQILKIQLPGQAAPLFLINSRIIYECPPTGCDAYTEPLCGSAGCAYFAYRKEGNSYRRVFKEYLKDLLPPDLPFLRVSTQLSQGLPCLEFTELPDVVDGSKIRVSRFCSNGHKYVLTHQEYQSLPKN